MLTIYVHIAKTTAEPCIYGKKKTPKIHGRKRVDKRDIEPSIRRGAVSINIKIIHDDYG
jgi:hypothetical protein